jgi:beta-xylosidase
MMKNLFRFLLCLLAVVNFSTMAFGQIGDRVTVWGDWPTWGDQGDGTYLNPVLPADYSDIDCIRVGSDYYAISSTMQYSPGMVILHSKDMVNWEIIGHVVSDVSTISPAMNWDQMNRYGRGIWAGSIRYYNNKFWVYFPTPDEGIFMTTATSAAGPWAPATNVISASGWDDCCPFWDDNGQGYLVATQFSNNYTTYIYQMSPDGTQIITSTGTQINQGSNREANKLYKINGIYYHMFSTVVSGARFLMMQSSTTSILGPYTASQQLHEPDTISNQPNQGGLVQAENGNWYFYTHHGTGAWEGRCNSLLPVTWINNWPIIGTVDANGIGAMTWSGTKPVAGAPLLTPATSDEFNETTLPPQWEWNYQPRAGYWSLTSRSGWLRLTAFMPLATDDLTQAGDTLTQRSFRTNYNQVITKLDLTGMTDGQKTGLCHFNATNPASFGAIQSKGVRSLELKVGSTITSGPVLSGTNLWLGSTWGLDGVSQFSYSTDGVTFTNFGSTYQLTFEDYRGDRIGVYCYNNLTNSGQVDVDYFRYNIQPPTASIVQANPANGSVTLVWSQVAEASAYQVNRATSSAGPYTAIGTVTSALSYTDTGLVNGTSYYYTITTIPISPATAVTSASVQVIPSKLYPINNQLVEWLRFDGTSGATALDSSGNGMNATLMNAPTWVAGKINNAIAFNGTNQYGMLPTGIVNGLSSDYSITAWVNVATLSSWSRVFDFGTGQTNYMFLSPENGTTSTVRFAITTGGSSAEQRIDGFAALPVGVWTHVAVTVAGSIGTLYVNGVAVGTNTAMTFKPSNLGSTNLNYLGKSQYNDPYFNGSLDEFKISNRAFTATEIASMAAQTPFSQWATQYSSLTGGITGTPENDGVSNLFKYFCDINPTVPMTVANQAVLPTVGTDTTTLPGTSYLSLTYRMSALACGVTINLQGSPDLKTWTTLTPDINQQIGKDGVTGDPIMELGVKLVGTCEFLRLNITSP